MSPDRELALELGKLFAQAVIQHLPAARDLLGKTFDDVHQDVKLRFARNKKGEINCRLTISVPKGRYPRSQTFSLGLSKEQMDLFSG